MTKPKTIEIISYDGKYPNLCSGRLTLKVGGKEYVTHPGVLCPGEGAGCSRDSDGNWTTDRGDWFIYPEDLPKEIRRYAARIESAVNESDIEKPCCGGCI